MVIHTYTKVRRPLSCFLALLLLALPASRLAGQIEPPEIFVGHKIGADKTVVDWQKIVAYFQMLAEKSDRLRLEELGKTTLGDPFLMAIISSAHNLRNLAKYKNLQRQAVNPRQLSDQDARLLARRNVVVVMVLLNASSDAVASSQTGLELAYQLASAHDPERQKILDNVLLLLVPCMNPDGLQRAIQWYDKYLDTPHESSPLTDLSHPYAGDEYNHDWVAMNLPETRMVAKQIYQVWFPEIIYIQEETNSQEARFWLQTSVSESTPDLHPLLRQQLQRFGKTITANLTVQSLVGVQQAPWTENELSGLLAPSAWWQHRIGIHASAANVVLATPVYFPKGSLRRADGGTRIRKESEPWPGGWWRLRDVIDYELAAILAMLKIAASEKETIVYNFCRMNLDALARGKKEPPYAYIVHQQQHDDVVATQMLDFLLQSGVEIHRANSAFRAGGRQFNKGDYVVLLSQSLGPFANHLLGRRPDAPTSNHGLASHGAVRSGVLPAIMGVEAVRVEKPFKANLSPVRTIRTRTRRLLLQVNGSYLIGHESNRSFIAVNRLLEENKTVYWLGEQIEVQGQRYPPGTIYVPANEKHADKMDFLAQELAIDVRQTKYDVRGRPVYRLREPRIGLFQAWIPNADEGWTRLLLEKFEFRVETVFNSRIRSDNLKGAFDVIILPDMAPDAIIHGWRRLKPNVFTPQVPRSYLNGISDRGIENLKAFVMKGGTLVALGRSCEFAVEYFGLPVERLRGQVDFPPSSKAILELLVHNSEPLAYGMPGHATALLSSGEIFRPKYWTRRTGVAATIKHIDSSPGESADAGDLSGLPVVLNVPMGEGRVVLIGIRAQYRAMTMGTIKFLFNAIHLARTERDILQEDH
ncbi:MAG: M14 family zinc carboxypeptidase [bacterium]